MARVEEQHHTLKPIRPVVGLARMLAQTHPIAVASGGVREHVHRSLEIVGIADLFSVVVTQEDVANSKPLTAFFSPPREWGSTPLNALCSRIAHWVSKPPNGLACVRYTSIPKSTPRGTDEKRRC